jgi:hypothetical protein
VDTGGANELNSAHIGAVFAECRQIRTTFIASFSNSIMYAVNLIQGNCTLNSNRAGIYALQCGRGGSVDVGTITIQAEGGLAAVSCQRGTFSLGFGGAVFGSAAIGRVDGAGALLDIEGDACFAVGFCDGTDDIDIAADRVIQLSAWAGGQITDPDLVQLGNGLRLHTIQATLASGGPAGMQDGSVYLDSTDGIFAIQTDSMIRTPGMWKHRVTNPTIANIDAGAQNETAINMDVTVAGRTVTLLSTDTDGTYYVITKVDSSVNTVTIDPGTDTINGLTDDLILNSQWDSVTVKADGTNWVVV